MSDVRPLEPRRRDGVVEVGVRAMLGGPPPVPEPVFVEPVYLGLAGEWWPDEAA
ncbi:hypothetical protein [Streptomyces sp. NPDC002132]|uniref:hypothetical protein n=1 Tax=unclassified Streptomyces TaxID=2593676 RepID=UPI00331D1E94